jgi:hypothetical protein
MKKIKKGKWIDRWMDGWMEDGLTAKSGISETEPHKFPPTYKALFIKDMLAI